MKLNEDFYNTQSDQSRVKSKIVSDYFAAWATVINSVQNRDYNPSKRMQYIDLYSGPGYFKDGNKSTPILILETIIGKKELSEQMFMLFNDSDAEHIKQLESEITQLKGYSNLKNKPLFFNQEINEDFTLVFKDKRFFPTFFFLDPWGYKGLSLELFISIIKDWGCDCVFFFNYNRVNIDMNNPIVDKHLTALFGEKHIWWC
jgi:three-Cys-motif partner protein